MRLTVGLLGVFTAFIALAQPWASPSLSATPAAVEGCHTWDIWGSTAFESARFLNYKVSQGCTENTPVSSTPASARSDCGPSVTAVPRPGVVTSRASPASVDTARA